jgi:hypothetical protein
MLLHSLEILVERSRNANSFQPSSFGTVHTPGAPHSVPIEKTTLVKDVKIDLRMAVDFRKLNGITENKA